MANPLISQVPVGPLVLKDGTASPGVQTLLSNMVQIHQAGTQNGPTSQRPTAASTQKRWIGMHYFDKSLGAHGKSITLASVNPDVWVDGTGASV